MSPNSPNSPDRPVATKGFMAKAKGFVSNIFKKKPIEDEPL